MIEQERCPDCKGIQKSIEILEKSDIEMKQNINALTTSLNDVSNRFSELTGMLKPTLKNLDKLIADQEKIHTDIQSIKNKTVDNTSDIKIARAEIINVRTETKTYIDSHGKVHKVLKWAVPIMGGSSIVGIIVLIAKLAGIL